MAVGGPRSPRRRRRVARPVGALLERAGLSSAAAHHALCAAFCALSRDDLEGVVAVLQPRLAIDGGMGLMGEPLGVAPLLVEALVGLGRRAEAAELARRLDEVTPARAPAVLDAPRHRCLALVEEDPEPARAAYDAAITAYAAAPDVFELARTRLLLGSWLRRRGDRMAAREQLGLAADAFGRMELPPGSPRPTPSGPRPVSAPGRAASSPSRSRSPRRRRGSPCSWPRGCPTRRSPPSCS